MEEQFVAEWPVSSYRNANDGAIDNNNGTIACYVTEIDGEDYEFQFLHYGKRLPMSTTYQCRDCKNKARRTKQSIANTSLKILKTSGYPLGHFQTDPKALSHICEAKKSKGKKILLFFECSKFYPQTIKVILIKRI